MASRLAAAATLSLAYLAAALASLQLGALGHGVTPLWLPSGIALGGLLMLGLWAWPAVALPAMVAAAIGAHAGPVPMVLAALGDTLEPIVGVLLLTRVLPFDRALARAREVTPLLVAAAVAPLVSASIGVPTFVATGFIAREAAGSAWLVWWLGNLVGIMVTAPAVLVMAPRARFPQATPRASPALGAALLLGTGLLAVAGILRNLDYLFLLMPPVLVATLIWRMRGAALAVFTSAVLVVAYASFRPELLTARPSGETILLVQSLLLVLSVTALVLAGNLEWRERIASDLRRTGSAYRSLVDASPFPIVGRDLSDRITMWNAAAERLYGWRADEVLGSLGTIIPLGSEAEFRAAQAAIGRGERVDVPSTRRVGRDGEVREVGLNIAPVRDASGQVVGGMAIVTDLTAERQALARLRASEERFAMAARASNDAIYDWDILADRIWWSESWESMFGHAAGENPCFDTWSSLVHPDDRARVGESLEAALESSESSWCADYRLQRADGSWAFLYDRGYIVRDSTGRAVRMVGAATDVTARREAEVQLRESERRLRTLVEHVLDVICEVDGDTRIRYLSPSVESVLGYPVDELLGRHALEMVHPDDFAVAGETVRRSLAETGAIQRTEVRVRRADGEWVRFEATAKRAVTADGRPRVIVAGRDVTARRLLEERLQRATRLEAVGVLAGGVAHDFNNLLTALLGHSDLILRELEPTHPLREDATEIRRAGLRAAELTRQLLAFSRRQVVAPRAVNLSEAVRGVASMLNRLMGEDVELVLDLVDGLPMAYADINQLEQVVVNLAANARDAMPHGGRLTIRTRVELASPEHSAGLPPAIAERRHLVLEVEDNGEGMDAETLAHMFEPFYTTKPTGRGTGLGLATVYGIVTQAGGHIEARSEAGAGASFTIRLPIATAEQDTPVPPEPMLPADRRGSETILLVEDEDPVRILADRILSSEGYRVLAAADADQARALTADATDRIHLLLTDVIMPGRSGPVLAESLIEELPELGVLYMSGYTDGQLQRQGVLRPGVAFLPKPFTPDELVRAVRRALDAASSPVG